MVECLIERLQQIDAAVGTVGALVEPHVYCASAGVDIVHLPNLMISLHFIPLVDANRIYPELLMPAPAPDGVESDMQVLTKEKRLAVDENLVVGFLISPGVGEGFIINIAADSARLQPARNWFGGVIEGFECQKSEPAMRRQDAVEIKVVCREIHSERTRFKI